MKANTILIHLGTLILPTITLAACQTQVTEQVSIDVITQTVATPTQTAAVTEEVVVTQEVRVTPEPTAIDEPITARFWDLSDLPDLDPVVSEDVQSINSIEGIFVQLTNYDPATAEIVPEAATAWEISDDGLTYIFNIRNDIPWVHHNPVTGETVQEVDREGVPRFLTANDFVFGIKRACDPNLASYYGRVIAPQIKGCQDVLDVEDPGDEDTIVEAKDAVGVSAPDDATLVIQLESPTSFFLSMTPMWPLTAIPQWAIEEHGDAWVEADKIVTNGRFVLNEWEPGFRRVFKRNPLMPEDMTGGGNIEQIVFNVVPDISTGYAMWLNNEVDVSAIPPDMLPAHLDQYPDETVQIPDLAVFYIAFRTTKPPFDDPQVRRAFSAAFDRVTFVTEVLEGRGLPMTHFAPPGIFGAPPIDQVGLDFDPDLARNQFEAAGYPNCVDFPQVTLLGFDGRLGLKWLEFAQDAWAEHLGCPRDLIQVEQQTFSELLDATAAETDDVEAPHMWTLAWAPDYADENNWVGDVLWCRSPINRQKRTCSEIDNLIIEAGLETDPNRRVELYAEIEEAFFGPDGETPFFPIFLRINFVAEHGWIDRVPSLFGGDRWYAWTIDQAAQLAARK